MPFFSGKFHGLWCQKIFENQLKTFKVSRPESKPINVLFV